MELFRKLFGSTKPPVDRGYRGDYGNLLLPPSAEAATILWSLNEEEQVNFKGLLNCAQESYESAGQQGPVEFHPDARASLWGAALSKLADHYLENDQIGRAFFFSLSAWSISANPVFAYNSGILAIALGDVVKGKNLLQIYLDSYHSILTNTTLMIATPDFTANDFEQLATKARRRLDESE
jgi:hypothetical protein